jgi:hypothetical protein
VTFRASDRWAFAPGVAAAGAFALLAVTEALVNARRAVAVPYAFTAVTIAGPPTVELGFLRGARPGPGTGDDRGWSDGGNGPPPPWWPAFEHAFWADVERRDRAPRPSAPRTPGY